MAVLMVALAGLPASQARGVRSEGDVRAAVAEGYGRLPLAFEANAGQTDPRVRFSAGLAGARLFLTDRDAVLALSPDRGASTAAALRLVPVGGQRANVVGVRKLAGVVNDLAGADPAAWRTGVPTFGRVAQRNVWPGIDLVYYGRGGEAEYDVVVSAGADPGDVRLRFEGADAVRLEPDGGLAIITAAGTVRQRRPVAYQDGPGGREPVTAGYVVSETGEVTLDLGRYDRSRALVVDPTLVYATYVGTSADRFEAVAVDPAGSAYLTGSTISTTFPTTIGPLAGAPAGQRDAFVTKLSPDGSSFVYSTRIGGRDYDDARDIAVDASGAAYVAGGTGSADFPTTAGAFARLFNQGNTPPETTGPPADAFVAKLTPSGAGLAYSTFLGGTLPEVATGITVDGSGAAYVVGETASADFPVTAGAFDTTYLFLDFFVTKLNAGGSALIYSTYVGGSHAEFDADLAIDAAGAAYIAGRTDGDDYPVTPGAFDQTSDVPEDVVVTKLNPTGTALVYSTYLAGNDAELSAAIAVDAAGAAYVSGSTLSTNFPVTAGAMTAPPDGHNVFVTKLSPSGSALVYSSLLDAGPTPGAVAVDAAGTAWIAGRLDPGDSVPLTPDALDTSVGGLADAYLARLSADGRALLYSTVFGGSSTEQTVGIALDGGRGVYVAGVTSSADFPVTAGAADRTYSGPGPQSGDGFVLKILAPARPTITTQASPGNLLGAPVRDTATLAGGVAPTGEVTFRLFSDATCKTQVFTSTNPVTAGTATSGNFTPSSAGIYYWSAAYSGDRNNEPASSPCTAPGESVVIAPFAPPPCTRTLTGDVAGPVGVRAGETVCITNARVTGAVSVAAGGAVVISGSQVSAGISADRPAFFSLCGSQVAAPSANPSQGVVVTNAGVPVRIGDPANGCATNRVAGDVTLTSNTAGLTLGGNVVSRNVTVNGNVGSSVVKANTVYGTLACTGNAPPPTNAGQPNTAASKTGQCAEL